MITLLPRLKTHFDELQDRMECFCKQGVQVEGWFKGELLTLLERGRAEGWIDCFDREVRGGGGKVDLTVTVSGEDRAWVELKHWLIGEQKGTLWKATSYFGDKEIGLLKDAEKLDRLQGPVSRWILLLLTENPGTGAWEAGIERFHEKFAPRKLIPHSLPEEFPPSYFLGLLQVAVVPQV